MLPQSFPAPTQPVPEALFGELALGLATLRYATDHLLHPIFAEHRPARRPHKQPADIRWATLGTRGYLRRAVLHLN